MHVVATAGHVDHGKSTLVRALTGMEPDRWAEERRRGMTIDLGYAWTTLPSGAELAFVDVPGHQRFIGNMLAGLGPVPSVLFVVAADEGWRRQSEEHLAAADALGIRHGLLVVTRSDLADPEPAIRQARERIVRSSLGDVPAVSVSGVTGQGLDELRIALDRLVLGLPAPDTGAPVRLWIDRCFTVRGSGTVVTGTLGAGTLSVDDDLDLTGHRVRVRGLQRLGIVRHDVSSVARVAVNLRTTPTAQVGRGDVLLTPGAFLPTSSVDVRISDPSVDLARDEVLHVGSAAVAVHVRPLGADIVRLRLQRPLPLRAGDRAILRDPGRHLIVAGALVLDADPPPLTRRGAAGRRAAALAGADGHPDLATEVSRRGAVRRSRLVALGVDVADLPSGVRLIGDWLVSPERWQAWRDAMVGAVGKHAASNPLEPGLSYDAARREAGLPDQRMVEVLAADAGLALAAGRIRLPGSAPTLGAAEQSIAEIEARLRADPFAAPERSELVSLRVGTRELAAAEHAGRLVRLADDLVLLPTAPNVAVAILSELPQPFTASQARLALGTTRRVAIPLLEYLDRAGRTRVLAGHARTIVR